MHRELWNLLGYSVTCLYLPLKILLIPSTLSILIDWYFSLLKYKHNQETTHLTQSQIFFLFSLPAQDHSQVITCYFPSMSTYNIGSVFVPHRIIILQRVIWYSLKETMTWVSQNLPSKFFWVEDSHPMRYHSHLLEQLPKR